MADEPVGILILDDDPGTRTALAQVLSAEGWHVEVATDARQALHLLAAGAWSLVVANVVLTGLDGPVVQILRELAEASAPMGTARRVRTLFLVPEAAAPTAQPALEQMGLPFVLKPIHLHDFLERVSDQLLEAGVLEQPIRHEFRRPTEQAPRKPAPQTTQTGRMFAPREDYYLSEEELAEWERQEAEARNRKKKPEPGGSLGES
ncbi:MAG: response regulator [Firmicutes bacterium]|nr:response regulator [Bacillota bacterium]